MFWQGAGAALVGGGLSAIGGIFGANSAKEVNRDQINAANINNAQQLAHADKWNQIHQDFNVNSAKNKYQWTVEDMRKAGLNPMLTMSQGAQGGSSASGLGYNPTTPQLQNPGGAIQAGFTGAGANAASAINSAAAMKNAETQEAVGHANIAIASERVLNLATERNLTTAQTYKIEQEINNLVAQLKLTEEQSALAFAQTGKTKAETHGLRLSNEQKEILMQFYRMHENTLIAKELNMNSIIRTIMPGIEDTIRQWKQWRNK